MGSGSVAPDGWAKTRDRYQTRARRDHPLRPPHLRPPGDQISNPSLFQMGWFGSSTPEPTAVTRGGRQHCWDNRDTYFACLDNNNVLKPGDEGKVCATEKVAYEKSCAKSWVRRFLQTSLRTSRIRTGPLDRILQQKTHIG